ncbi:MAG TPA: hypothetical protein DEB31_06485 [Clostridiales bacterium]|nr:hypothetical protein [Clostridiales bacterium]
MGFFETITPAGVAGLALIAIGAPVTFLSAKLSKRMRAAHANLIVKCIGLAAVIAGFACIMFL